MRWWTLALIWFGTSAAFAGPSLDAAYARRLMRAKTTREADRLRARYDDARVARLGCRLQLSRGLAPLACYEAIAREVGWGVLSRIDRVAARTGLDQACARAAAALRVPEAPGSLRYVSPSCAARVRDARLTQAYRRAEGDHADWSGD